VIEPLHDLLDPGIVEKDARDRVGRTLNPDLYFPAVTVEVVALPPVMEEAVRGVEFDLFVNPDGHHHPWCREKYIITRQDRII
jgi:hypothetical protein